MFEDHYDRWWGMVHGTAITGGIGLAVIIVVKSWKVRLLTAAITLLLLLYALTQPERYWSHKNYWHSQIREDSR